ncbi:MAG: FAD:protein FMN transferase [Bacteroidaceae bacterium]|nr:FAD:protein FMN transferase [Bacteroidaceae bacterium]
MPHLFHPAQPQNRYYAWFEALHTRVDLLLFGTLSESDFEAVESEVRACLDRVEHMGNRFNPESELSLAVAAATTRPVSISPELYSLLSRCLQANRDTGGLFDITVNSPKFYPGLIDAIHLHDGTLSIHRPSPPSLTSETAPAADVPHRASSPSLTAPDADVPHRASPPSFTGGVPEGWGGSSSSFITLDLSGILKGYALERLRALLPTLGITDALINLGNSSILSLGHNPSDIPPGHCLTTSGNATAQRRHIRHPLTGEFVTGQRQVSVTTTDAIDGEIASIVAFLQSESQLDS